MVLAVVLLGAVALDPGAQVVGGVRTYEVRPNDTLTSVGARAGIEVRTLARDNALSPTARLRTGDSLTIDNRHIVPAGLAGGIVLNIPQRMLFVTVAGTPTRGYPVAVGRSTWRTPLGSFAVAVKEVDPVWDVPVSIQREMEREGRVIVTKVRPGPDNPLGTRWIGLSVPGVGIHGTNEPGSVYRFTTHGCIRMHPDDVAALFDLVEPGTAVEIIYEPVLLADAPPEVLLEVHRDIYGMVGSLETRTADLLRAAGLDDLIRSVAVRRAIAERAGRAVRVAPANAVPIHGGPR